MGSPGVEGEGRAGDQDLAVREQAGGAVVANHGLAADLGDVGPRRPGAGAGVDRGRRVDGGLAMPADVAGTEIDDLAVVHQHGGADLVHDVIDNRDRERTFVLPGIRRYAVAFRTIRREALRRDDGVVGKQNPGFLVGANRLAGRRVPRICDRIVDDAFRGGKRADHEAAVGQDAAGGVADLRPAGRRRDRAPAVGDGIVDLALVGVASGAALLATDQNDAPVPEHSGSVVAPPEAHVRKRRPGAVDVAALAVGGEGVPMRGGFLLNHDPAVGQKDHGAGVERRLVNETVPSACHSEPPSLRRAALRQDGLSGSALDVAQR